MKLEEAKTLRSALDAAIAAAEESGQEEIGLLDALDAVTEQAVAELEAAAAKASS